jgi:hypothetical protein
MMRRSNFPKLKREAAINEKRKVAVAQADFICAQQEAFVNLCSFAMKMFE